MTGSGRGVGAGALGGRAVGLFGITLDDLAAARRRIQDRSPGRYFEIWPDVFEKGLYWVGAQTKGLLESTAPGS